MLHIILNTHSLWIPKLGYEPTSMRAVRARYDPFIQAKNRIDQLKVTHIHNTFDIYITHKYFFFTEINKKFSFTHTHTHANMHTDTTYTLIYSTHILFFLNSQRLGHPVDKVEYIIMGGTFMALDKQYKYKSCVCVLCNKGALVCVLCNKVHCMCVLCNKGALCVCACERLSIYFWIILIYYMYMYI